MTALPNKITTDQELYKWCHKNIPGFNSVISRTQFKTKISELKPGDSMIINLDPGYKHGGTHWVALRVSSEAPIIYYKDSFGAPPPEDVSKQCNKIGYGCVYGNRINQKLREVNCGKRSADWLRNMSKAAESGREIEYFENSELNAGKK